MTTPEGGQLGAGAVPPLPASTAVDLEHVEAVEAVDPAKPVEMAEAIEAVAPDPEPVSNPPEETTATLVSKESAHSAEPVTQSSSAPTDERNSSGEPEPGQADPFPTMRAKSHYMR